jgi:PPOX class probable F420-dependent enzyme
VRKNLRPEELGDLLVQPKVAILATHCADGSELLTPVWHEWTNGGFTIVIDGNDAKIRNLRRDPRVSIVVAEDEPPYRGFEIRGEVRFIDSDAGVVLRRLAERYLNGRDVAGFMNRMQGWTQESAVTRIEPGVLRAWDYADEEW